MTYLLSKKQAQICAKGCEGLHPLTFSSFMTVFILLKKRAKQTKTFIQSVSRSYLLTAIIQRFHTVIMASNSKDQHTYSLIASLAIVESDCIQFDYIQWAGPGGTTEWNRTLALPFGKGKPSALTTLPNWRCKKIKKKPYYKETELNGLAFEKMLIVRHTESTPSMDRYRWNLFVIICVNNLHVIL